ncbi:Gfo/Idh/MocA family oxidoreductase [Paenibacillus sp. N1-5-1-14]|uniref:Gfo/Idh/MocA family protein n=1 Tax=Paenibacillus radicibacter TaxID=2972488 RepID=UPI002158F6A5|nr:Gfo/Idh/MocA family oxidoreductase [Paenibacillus radicibacter]MCR8643964.1 Gfo/Idh/MocA family oxidoreductase [Paenibacillus radicibacter]
MIKVGMISFWHVHAGDYAKLTNEHPDTEIVGIWDENPERGRQEAENRGVPFYNTLEELLSQDDITAVIVDSPTSTHRDVMIQAARAGKHIFTEKVLAPTLREANEIIQAVREAGVSLTVSLPRLYHGYTKSIMQVLDNKWLGELTQVRVRVAHNGAIANWLPEHFYNKSETHGGAMIDLGCHPMYLTRLFLGEPDRVSTQYGYVTGREVEDNAISILTYPSGAIGIVETGFVTPHSPFTIEIHGTTGTLLYGFQDADKLYVRSSTIAEGHIEIPIESPTTNSFDMWVNSIHTGLRTEYNLAMAIDLTKLMEASNLSWQEQRVVKVSELKA